MLFRLIITLAFFIEPVLVFSQDTLVLHFSKTITKEELSAHVYRLASEEFGGRFTGSKGQFKAADYIMKEFKASGLHAPEIYGKPSYVQPFILDNCRWKDQRLTVDGKPLKVGKDFLFLSDPIDIQETFPVVFAGFGIEDPAYSDFGNIDVKDKIMLVFSGEPYTAEGLSVISGKEEQSKKGYYFSKSALASQKGAAGLIIIAKKEADFKNYLKNEAYYDPKPNISYPDDDEGTMKKKQAFTAFMDLKTAALLVQEDPKSLAAALNEMESGLKSTAGRFSGEVTIEASSDCYPMETANIIGLVEGTDKKTQAVVVVAHYDHLGVRGGNIYYGADDNASGTAAVMEIAEAFALAARDGLRPRRTVIFLAVSAEELGLYGSKFYTENPLFPLDSTMVCLNIDMIGRASTKLADNPDYISGYAYLSKDLLEVSGRNIRETTPELEDRMEYRASLRGGSDHYYFSKHGIPSLFYFAGFHKDYHEPTDTPDKILYDRMEKIVRAIFTTTWELANREEKLATGN
jgi:Zn-dependent M28 family amino/carboxypeptidase